MPNEKNPGRMINFRAKTAAHLAELRKRGKDYGGMSAYINDKIFSRQEDLRLSIAALKNNAKHG